MGCRIIHGDCVAELAKLEAGSAHLVFADPPYNIGVDYGPDYDDNRPLPEFLAWCERWMWAVHRVLSPDGSFWLLVNHERMPDLCILARQVGFHRRQVVVWYET